MPAILDRLVRQLRANGHSRASAYAIATSALQKSGNLKPGSREATTQGKKRGKMTPAQRALDRAKRRKPGHYKYNPHNNSAVKGKINPEVQKRA